MTDLNNLAIRAAVLKILSDRVNTELKEVKEEIQDILGPEGRKNPTFDGVKLASVFVSKHGRFSVNNKKLFTDWVAENYPTEVHEVLEVRPAFLRMIKEASETAGVPIMPDGTMDIPGVEIGEPYTTVRKDPNADAAVESFWNAGRLGLDGRLKEIES